MTTLGDLKKVLKDTLEARGTLNKVKARIRAEIFAALDDQDEARPELSSTNLVINELIREYLEYNGYRNTLSVFLPETGQPETRMGADFLAQQLRVPRDSKLAEIPLIYTMVAKSQQAAEGDAAPATLEAPAKTAINLDGGATSAEGKASGVQTMRPAAGPGQQLEFSGGGSQGLSFKRA